MSARKKTAGMSQDNISFILNTSIFTTDQRMDFVQCNHPDVNPVNGERDSHHESMLVNSRNEQTRKPPPIEDVL
jgi:hypothetical protein